MADKTNLGVWAVLKPFAIGGTAGSMATCCVQPIDMIMKRSQMTGQNNMFKVGRNIFAEEGALYFYNGLSAGLCRQLTYGLTRLGLFGTLQKRFQPEDGSPLPFLTKLGCSLAAGGIGAFVGTPPDAALVRMQGDSLLPEAQRRNYKHVGDALGRMWKEEGAAGFFSGATPTICRGLAINVGMLTSYSSYKRMLQPYTGKDTQATRFAGGALSGWTAATVALPFDFVKTQLQQQKVDPKTGQLPYKGIADCFAKIVAQRGPQALYTGYPTFVVRITPHIMLTWVFIDFFNGIL
mmetsp:Transcript_2216/g.2580  ORF Transcript_2216/g.2580 Transcript_2216/m.2580 type:complete len:293 (-) Transcript_2216:134-1012(-)|eukprot:CAMPEP_0205822804 /NCGR_PEP_ID=MMETSP0206-20130828/14122_1 /ASSEMBLY_ACC=CAM_ASM_000279 /TAXON_ID=36767 /ORGANISM="Euplotes focardii, Strain TN1" /LENGTH=292 /DNA_ID=CAMNT_0053119389 /DNA_START=27 /DNA_END=905 /DNA_ORIENTATION=+